MLFGELTVPADCILIIPICREIFHPDISTTELPAHIYLRSIHNISVERGWLRLRLDFGDNAVAFFNYGIDEGIYNYDDPQHLYVVCHVYCRFLDAESSQ